MMENIHKYKLDWDLIGFQEPTCILNYKGMKLNIEKVNGDIDIVMYLDGVDVMSTKKIEHISMIESIDECPEDARVLIGGFGFGLILLYLAESKKSKEVIVIEKDVRVIEKIVPNVTKYLEGHYPNFNFKVIQGDIYNEVSMNGLFDWIFIDISDWDTNEFKELSKNYLTEKGMFTSFKVKNA